MAGNRHDKLSDPDGNLPYFAAFARACRSAGKTLWINVESAQIEVPDWQHYLDLEKLGSKEPKAGIMPWKVTSMDWLEPLELLYSYSSVSGLS